MFFAQFNRTNFSDFSSPKLPWQTIGHRGVGVMLNHMVAGLSRLIRYLFSISPLPYRPLRELFFAKLKTKFYENHTICRISIASKLKIAVSVIPGPVPIYVPHFNGNQLYQRAVTARLCLLPVAIVPVCIARKDYKVKKKLAQFSNYSWSTLRFSASGTVKPRCVLPSFFKASFSSWLL